MFVKGDENPVEAVVENICNIMVEKLKIQKKEKQGDNCSFGLKDLYFL